MKTLENFRPLMRVEVFEPFTLLLIELLVGEAKRGIVRSSVFAPADYQPARISDIFTTHRVSPQKLMARLTELVLRLRHSETPPERMFWIADSARRKALRRKGRVAVLISLRIADPGFDAQFAHHGFNSAALRVGTIVW